MAKSWASQGRLFPSIPIIDPILDQFWVDTKHFLEQSGYRLLPQFDPGWEPTNAIEERNYISLTGTPL